MISSDDTVIPFLWASQRSTLSCCVQASVFWSLYTVVTL